MWRFHIGKWYWSVEYGQWSIGMQWMSGEPWSLFKFELLLKTEDFFSVFDLQILKFTFNFYKELYSWLP